MEKFENLYDSLDKKWKKAIRKRIMEEADMSYPSFYRKMQDKTFTKLEREKIAEIVGKPVIELFPESDNNNISYK